MTAAIALAVLFAVLWIRASMRATDAGLKQATAELRLSELQKCRRGHIVHYSNDGDMYAYEWRLRDTGKLLEVIRQDYHHTPIELVDAVMVSRVVRWMADFSTESDHA